MSRAERVRWLERLRRRWLIASTVKVLMQSLAIAAAVGATLYHFFSFGIAGFAITFILAFSILSGIKKFWALSLDDICRFVNRRYPEVEESASLLILPAESLGGLQQLQANRVNQVLVSRKQPVEPFKQLLSPGICLVFSCIFLYVVYQLPPKTYHAAQQIPALVPTNPIVKENVPAEISNYNIIINPPRYTGKSSREQKQFTIIAEQGATLQWKIQTSLPVKNVSFIWNDQQTIPLINRDKQGAMWQLQKTLTVPGFYQVVFDGKKSDLYQVEVIPDQAVAFKVVSPQQHSTIDIGQPQRVALNLVMTDDYGISAGYISATVANGKGEAVKFNERKIALNTIFKNQKRIQLSQQLLLTEMGMKPGDELYFYINATDNHGQQSRSDMYFVSIQDTTELMSMASIDNGVNLVPAYFRSQRQIIIDTEKLLAERASLSDADFKERSNALGADQKMLRLRYGKFLGEESEDNIGAGQEEKSKADPAQFGNASAILNQYADKHDQAEDATFFEPEMKTQLKATLTEMWNAELQLRTYVPAKALPFEYKALRLLKDLQQKSRAFVAKTTSKTSPLQTEKRLSGDLTAISGLTSKSNKFDEEGSNSILQQTLALLEERQAGQKSSPAAIRTLQAAERELLKASTAASSKYLPALNAFKTVIANWHTKKQINAEISRSARGINELLGRGRVHPFARESQPSDLSNAYFKLLSRSSR